MSGSPDEAFAKLKEAREYALMATADRHTAEAIFNAASDTLNNAKSVEDDAMNQLAEAKSKFDALFTSLGDT